MWSAQSEDTFNRPIDEPVYFESQRMCLCGLHTVNNLFQERIFMKKHFDFIAEEFDAKEREIEPDKIGTPSTNHDGYGNYTIQVLTRAVELVGHHLINLNSTSEPRAVEAISNTANEEGFIIGTGTHWLALRKLGNKWWKFDSILPKPELLNVKGQQLELFETAELRKQFAAIYLVV